MNSSFCAFQLTVIEQQSCEMCDKAGNSGGIPFCIKKKTEENEHERANQEQTDYERNQRAASGYYTSYVPGKGMFLLPLLCRKL